MPDPPYQSECVSSVPSAISPRWSNALQRLFLELGRVGSWATWALLQWLPVTALLLLAISGARGEMDPKLIQVLLAAASGGALLTNGLPRRVRGGLPDRAIVVP